MPQELLVIGHRGAMGYVPENTMASFRKAVSLGVDCVEFDVHLIEEHLLVIHDEQLERTTNGKGLLTDHSFVELRKLDAGHGEKIPTLDEVFEEVAGKAALNIELKGKNTARPVAEFIAEQRKKGCSNETFLVSSFDRKMLFEIRDLDPQLLLGVLVDGPVADHFVLAEQLNAHAVHPSLEQVDRGLVQEAHRRYLKIFVYTVNEIKDLKRMIKLRVDGVFTNYPDRALNLSIKGKDLSGWL